MNAEPNNRTETNPAMTGRLQSESNWSGVVYPRRWAFSMRPVLFMFIVALVLAGCGRRQAAWGPAHVAAVNEARASLTNFIDALTE